MNFTEPSGHSPVLIAESRTDLLGQIPDWMPVVPDRSRLDGKRTHEQRERWALGRLLSDSPDLWPFPVRIYHPDAPDFIAVGGDRLFGLEISDICDAGEQARWTEETRQDAGEVVVRDLDDAPDTEKIAAMAQMTGDAIRRKSQKPYASWCDLALYLNTTSALFLTGGQLREACCNGLASAGPTPFQRIWVVKDQSILRIR